MCKGRYHCENNTSGFTAMQREAIRKIWSEARDGWSCNCKQLSRLQQTLVTT